MLIRHRGRIDLKRLCFSIYFRDPIFGTRVIAEETRPTTATLALDSLKHVGQFARVVTGSCQKARAEQVVFIFIPAAKLKQENADPLRPQLRNRADWPAE